MLPYDTTDTTLRLCACGCGKTPRTPEARFYWGHNWYLTRRSVSERLWGRVLKTETCWLWQGPVSRQGYGRLGRGGEGAPLVLAHRAAWELTYGPIPQGLNCLHHCDTPRCVRPEHLFLGTTTDNMRDAEAKGRLYHARGSESHFAKFTESQVLAYRKRYDAGGITMAALAREVGTYPQTMRALLIGKTWSHLPLHP